MRIKTKKALQLGEGAKKDGSIGDRVVTKPGKEYTVSDDFKKDPFFQLAYKAGDIEVLAEPVEILVGEMETQPETPEAPEEEQPEAASGAPEETSAEPEAAPEETSAEHEAEPEETEPKTAAEDTPAKTTKKKTSK